MLFILLFNKQNKTKLTIIMLFELLRFFKMFLMYRRNYYTELFTPNILFTSLSTRVMKQKQGLNWMNQGPCN